MTTFPEDIPAEPEASPEISISPVPEAAEVAPAPAPTPRKPRKPSAVVSGGKTDEVLFSRVVPADRARTRKSLTLHHLQRRLAELGYAEAAAARDGQLDTLTQAAIEKWQADNKHPVGRLTAEQFEAIFKGDPNVTVVLDTPGNAPA